MKIKVAFLASALVVAGCSVDYQPATDNPLHEEIITIQGVVTDSQNTKTVLVASDGTILWTPGDAISLFYGSGKNGGSHFVSTASEPAVITNFTGTITAITGGVNVSPEDTFFWGVYPYGDDVSCDGSSVTLTLPSHQAATPGSFATGLFPSLGRSQGLVMGFYNICGGWRFSVTKQGIRKVTLRSNGGEAISGTVKVSFGEMKVPVIQEILDGSDEVVLECSPGEYFEVGRNYYIVLLPGTLPSGFTITFETYTEEGSYNRTASTTITRSKFIGITDIDNYLTTPFVLKAGNIPIADANFKAYLVENFDTGGDGEISYEEANAITSINTVTTNIASIQGIEYMPRLSSLNIRGSNSSSRGKLVSLDVSNNPVLKVLYCDYNQLTALDLRNTTALVRVSCGFNQISELDVSHNTLLSSLDCNDNLLSALEFPANSVFTELDCRRNQITYLDVSNSPILKTLNCSNNFLSSLDVSNNTALTGLICSNNNLTILDVSNNTALTGLWCDVNQLTHLDVSHNTSLDVLHCSVNQIKALDASNLTVMRFFSCAFNQLLSLNISNDVALEWLSCNNNLLSTLDISDKIALTQLDCSNNQLLTLDLSNIVGLQSLSCNNNLLSTLDVSDKRALFQLDCSNNQLLTLGLSNNVVLQSLLCNNNLLSTLDTSDNAVLYELDCSNNNIFSINLSNNPELRRLYCYTNLITSLDISHNTLLGELSCAPMPSLETIYLSPYQQYLIDIHPDYFPDGVEFIVVP